MTPGAPQASGDKTDRPMNDSASDDGLAGLGVNLRNVAEMEAGRSPMPKSRPSTSNGVLPHLEPAHIHHPRTSTNGAMSEGLGAMLVDGSDAEAPKAPLTHNGNDKQPQLTPPTSFMRPSQPSAQPSARVFKQAPKHDEHHEVAAAVIFSPKQTYDHIVATGVAKTQLSLAKQATQGVLAGFYISFSFMLCMTVGGQIPEIQHDHPGLYNLILGSVGFPLGLTVIMVVGADLFTSSCMYMMTAWLEGRVATYYVLKNWFVSWWFNLCGCLIMAQLVVWAGLFAGPKSAFPIYLAQKKTSATFGATLVKGILCNWLVNLAVWMANSARDVTGKAIGVYLPVSAFVTLGTEHVVANQFQLSLAKMLGSGMSLRTIICSNFIPATIGNIIGGAFFVGTLYAGTYGTLYERMWLRSTQLYVWVFPRRFRERVAAMQRKLDDRLFGWIDWDYITTAPIDALANAGPVSGISRVSTSGPSKPGRSTSTYLLETPRRVAGMAAAAMRNPPMTPFERQRTEAGLGADVV